MRLKEVEVTFPLTFLESLCSRLSTTDKNTRSFTATFAKRSEAKQCHCEIVTTVSGTSVQICIKSTSIQCKNESVSCNIDTWLEENTLKSQKRKRNTCRRPQKSNRSIRDAKQLINIPNNSLAADYTNPVYKYISENKSPKRKHPGTVGESGGEKKVKFSPNEIQNSSHEYLKINNSPENESKVTATSLTFDTLLDHQDPNSVENVTEISSVYTENEGSLAETNNGENITEHSDSGFLNVNAVIPNVNIERLVRSSDIPSPLKPVNHDTVNLRVSLGNALIGTSDMGKKKKTGRSSSGWQSVNNRSSKTTITYMQQNSVLFVKDAKVPVFYIRGITPPSQDSVLVGPFVLEVNPIPHLRLKEDDLCCYTLPKNWCWKTEVSCTEEGKDADISHMPSQPQRSAAGNRSSFHSSTVVEDMAAPDTSEESGQFSDPGDEEDGEEGQTYVKVQKKRRTRSILKKGIKRKIMRKAKSVQAVEGREATPPNTCEMKSKNQVLEEEETVRVRTCKKPLSKPKQKTKKLYLSKKGGTEAMYIRMSSHCIRIVPESGSDLWEAVSDPSLLVSKCKYCPNSTKSFPDPLILADHIRNIHKKEANYMDTVRECRAKMKLKCNLCVEDRFYSRWESFGMHMRDVHSDKCDEVINILKCSICNRTWVSRNKFERHMETVHGNPERFLCHLCPQTFKWESSLRSHIKGIHNKETAHVCETCGAIFSRKEYVRVHLQKHHFERLAGRSCKSRGIHCPICDLRLERKKDITAHMVEVHQFQAGQVFCKVCKAKFATDEDLEKHSADIHGNKQYQHCPYCGSGFQARDNMLRHIAKDHLKISPPKCPLCEKQFDYNTDLRFHLGKEHGYGDNDHTYGQADSLKSMAILKCEYCDKPSFWVMGLINHILITHEDKFPHLCKECGQRFKEGSSLQHHIAFRHIKASQCEEVRTKGVPVGAKQTKSGSDEKGKPELQSASSVNLVQSRKCKEVPSEIKQSVSLLKTPGRFTFQAPCETIQVPVPNPQGPFVPGNPPARKSSASSTTDQWNYPTGHWSFPPVQPPGVPNKEYVSLNPVTRTEDSVYHILDYVKDTADFHSETPAFRPVLPFSSARTDPTHLHPTENTAQPDQGNSDRADGLCHHIADRAIVHSPAVDIGDRCIPHTTTDRTVVHTSTVDKGMISAQVVNTSAEGSGTQLITAENLIGLLHEFSSQQQQQQANQFYNPQFY